MSDISMKHALRTAFSTQAAVPVERFDGEQTLANGTIGANGHAREQSWQAPDLTYLGSGRRPAPDFPIDLLGSSWSNWVRDAAAGASAPIDYVATALLASVGAVLANVRWPSAGSGWSEPPVLWVADVGPPSFGKSPAIDAVYGLVRAAEEEMASGFEETQRDFETKKQIAKARREAWEIEVKTAIKNGVPAPTLPDAAQEPDEPVRPRIRVADVTTERLGSLAAGLPRGLLLVRDELSGWLGGFDRYGGGGSDRAFALEMYGGRAYVVDRQKSPDPIRIPHLSIGVLGGVQPDKLAGIINTPDDGLISRLLWAWPDQLPRYTMARGLRADVMAEKSFQRLCDLPMQAGIVAEAKPVNVPLTKAAEDALEAFAREMQERAIESGGAMAGSIGKARGHALRLSCILEYIWWAGDTARAEPTSITDESVARAAGLVDGYFLPMAAKAFGDAAIPIGERRAMMLARHLRRERLQMFNARDVRRQIGGDLREPSHMASACELLVEAAIIRPAFTRAGGSSGRTAKTYEVNGAIFGARQ